MTNTVIFQKLINGYEELAYTNKYIFGFVYDGVVYASFAVVDLALICKLDKASRGAGYSLRFKPNKAQKVLLLMGAQPVCSVEFFNAEVKGSIYNKGEIFEKLVTETICGQKWEKDNVPFTKGGDVEWNGIAYQIKFEGATFINEKTLARLTA